MQISVLHRSWRTLSIPSLVLKNDILWLAQQRETRDFVHTSACDFSSSLLNHTGSLYHFEGCQRADEKSIHGGIMLGDILKFLGANRNAPGFQVWICFDDSL
ncbi:hypothetical protein H6F89_26040 [Cyanobacteria bacterium FACHB-63]|nr:hypothetical protein [Cyanobacteria bacterium FACHB-63]